MSGPRPSKDGVAVDWLHVGQKYFIHGQLYVRNFSQKGGVALFSMDDRVTR